MSGDSVSQAGVLLGKKESLSLSCWGSTVLALVNLVTLFSRGFPLLIVTAEDIG